MNLFVVLYEAINFQKMRYRLQSARSTGRWNLVPLCLSPEDVEQNDYNQRHDLQGILNLAENFYHCNRQKLTTNGAHCLNSKSRYNEVALSLKRLVSADKVADLPVTVSSFSPLPRTSCMFLVIMP